MSEPQAESALDSCLESLRYTSTSASEDMIAAARAELAALRSAYLAGQLAMRERCAKGLPRAVAIGIYGIDSLYTRGWNDAVARAEEALRALSPEEHRTVTVNQERNESHG